MSQSINRRTAMKSGAIAGAALGAGACAQTPESSCCSSAEATDYITPWSPQPDRQRDLTPGDTPVRLGSWSRLNTLDYPPRGDVDIDGMVKRIRDAGYVAGNANIPRYQKSAWMDASESEVRELKNALAKYDVDFFDMHTTGSNISLDLEQRRLCNRYTIDACDAADRVGAHSVTTHIGSLGTEAPMCPHRDNWTKETWDLGVNTFRELLSATAGYNCVFAMEAVNMTIMNNPRAHLRLIEELGDPRMKVCIDPVNMMNLSVYYRNTELIEECFDLLGEHIVSAHAKDSYIIPNRMSCYITEVAAGKGVIDYETYLVRLSRMEWPRTLLIEHLPEEEYPVAQKHIVETAARVGVKLYA
jgi:sugar phosphate isomerase/epimerase